MNDEDNENAFRFVPDAPIAADVPVSGGGINAISGLTDTTVLGYAKLPRSAVHVRTLLEVDRSGRGRVNGVGTPVANATNNTVDVGYLSSTESSADGAQKSHGGEETPQHRFWEDRAETGRLASLCMKSAFIYTGGTGWTGWSGANSRTGIVLDDRATRTEPQSYWSLQ